MVDGFKFQSPRCRHYFLTHYHADHTIGASKLQSLYFLHYFCIVRALSARPEFNADQ